MIRTSLRSFRGVGGSAAVCGLMICFGMIDARHSLGLATSVPLYLLGVLWVAWTRGFVEAVVVSTCATLCLDFFSTDPKFTFNVTSSEDVTALVSFACVSLLASHFSNKAHRAALVLEEQKNLQRLLYEVSLDSQLLDWRSSIGDQLCSLAQSRFHLRGVSLLSLHPMEFSYRGDGGQTLDVLRSAVKLDDEEAMISIPGGSVRVLRFGTRPVGAVIFLGDGFADIAADSFAGVAASTLERARAMRAEVIAESEKMSEQLRSALLDGLAHAAKTPLTTIAISSEGLQQMGELTPSQRELVDLIRSETARLSELTHKVLRTHEPDPCEMKLVAEPIDLHRLLYESWSESPEGREGNRLHAVWCQESPQIVGDREVLGMAFLQVFENALKYSPPESEISVSTRWTEGEVTVSVHNRGSYLAEEERELIFRRFYRSRSVVHQAPGTGLGLATAYRAIQAHRGRIRVESDKESGTTFLITVPAKKAIEEETK